MSADAAEIDAAERRDRLRLARSDNVGPVTYRMLMTRFGSAAIALEAAGDLSRRGGKRFVPATLEAAERELAAAEEIGARFVTLGEPDYPAHLAATDGAPPVVCVYGQIATLGRPCVAMVGSRNASVAGRKMAQTLAAGLGDAGYVVVSGLARGIDTAAHEGALATATVAVLAGGIDRIYPAENADLAGRIIEAGGALVSEMPFGREARGKDFPRRNRIISGLSVAAVVVEAARRSGSLITARLAAEQGRPVYAVPGSPLDPRAEGTNHLIREGATLVTRVDDLLDDIAPLAVREAPPAEAFDAMPAGDEPAASDGASADEGQRDAILAALGPTPVHIDDIVRFTGVGAPTVHLVLLELSLAGRTEAHPGQRVSLTG